MSAEILFIFIAYILGTGFGWYWGRGSGIKQGIADTVDSLIDQGYIKYKGVRSNPDILKHDEEY
jgi:hypothetical protein